MAALNLPETTIVSAALIPAGSFTPPGWQNKADLPAFCRVIGRIRPAINFEVWMPAAGWNGRFVGAGNGGFGGYINYDDLAASLGLGYSAASTDTGHTAANAPGQDGLWALGHPELIVDHAYRAIHEMTEKSKAIVKAFYAKDAKFSYFSGCSTGGRQGLMEAQRYPRDYDGIVAVAPVNFYTHLYGSMFWIRHATKEVGSALPNDKLALLSQAVLASCDAKDGVRDGVMEEPLRCQFDPGTLQCTAANAERCLTAAQVDAVRKIYGPAKYSRTGAEIFPGLAPGSEGGWNFLAGPNPFPVPVAFMKYFVFNDPNWDWRTFDFDKDMALMDTKYSAMFNATEPKLERFRARGGKIIMVHGWNDSAVSPMNSINYYNSVRSAIGDRNTDRALRLFMAPGRSHCGGGPGPSTFDGLAAITQWVEANKRPDQIIASHKTNGAVDRTRPLCPYPQIAKYKGSGSTDDAASFACHLPAN